MALAGRNEACPCGSGRKYKRCCGLDRAAETVLEDRLAAIDAIARLAYRSPRLLPDSDTFDSWVLALVAGEAEVDADAGIEALGAGESARILSACLALYRRDWDSLSARVGSDGDAVAALLGGAVAAGIRDFRPVDRWAVELIEESGSLAADPFEALAICLEGEQLWERSDGVEAERAVDAIPEWLDDDAYEAHWDRALGAVTAQLASEWHVRRLERLVGRVRTRLPFAGCARASAAVECGCAQFAAEAEARRRLAEILLGDMVGGETPRQLRASLVA